MLKELWCCNEYQVSDEGYILGKRGTKLKPYPNHNGYLIVNLMINNKRVGMAVHTAVAKTFLGVPDNDNMQVNHIDGDKTNNNITNLEWVTPKENTEHAINKLGVLHDSNSRPIYGYDKRTGEFKYEFDSLIDCGRFFALNNEKKARHIQTTIWRIANHYRGKKSYKGYIWSYDKMDKLNI